VLWGKQDRLVPPAHALAYIDALPDAHLVLLGGAGHFPYLESPEAFTQAVKGFLQLT
jgi:pimeloyl-ACP methyl ester carboxylesterase